MNERGTWTFGPIAGLAIVILAVIGFFALCTPDGDHEVNTLGPIELASHGYDDGCWDGGCYDGGSDQDYGSHDRNRNRNRDRGAFSPGPFRDSPVTICAPYSCNSGGEQSGGNRSENPPPNER